MASRRQPLTAPRAPKGGNIEDMLKFVREQQSKPSEAAATAKKLKNLSTQSKQREKFANQSKSFMKELRTLLSQAEYADQVASSSLIDLAQCLPELPTLLRMDANTKSQREDDIGKCAEFKDRLENILTRKRSAQMRQMFQSAMTQFKSHLEILELPSAYEAIADIVEKTKLPTPTKDNSYDLSDLPEEWKYIIQDQINVFAQVEKEMHETYRKWLVENNFNPDEKFGGWDELEHQRFTLCGENASLEFPDKPPEELHRHQKWIIRTQFLHKKVNSLRLELKKRVASLREEARLDIEEKERQALINAENEERRAQLAEEKEELMARLNIERSEKQEREAQIAALKEKELQEKLEEDRRQKQLADKQNASLKKKLLTEKERRMQREAELAEKKRQQEERERQLQKVRQKEISKNVTERKKIEEKRQMERLENELKQAELAAERKKRLDQLAQSVRDEFGLDDLKADPTKLTKLQQMRRNAEKEEKPLYVQTGFASSVIEADPRVRIENALREAGLIDSAYAHQVMQNYSAIRENQTMNSNIRFG